AASRLPRKATLLGSEQLATSVNDDDDVQLASTPGSVEMRGVSGDGLSGAAAGEETQEDAQVLRARNELLDSHARDVKRRQRGAQIGVSFVGADDESARLRDGEVHAGQAGLRGEELRAQMRSCRFRQLLRIGK